MREAPLTLSQERLWFLQRLTPDDASYNMYMATRLRGPFDRTLLSRALDEVVRRHEILRTVFPETAGTPVQRVLEPAPLDVELIDLTGSAAESRERTAHRLVAERTNTPFDLTDAPPFRVSLLRLAAEDHVLCFVLHHVIADGWSCGIVYAEMVRAYNAMAQGRPLGLAPLPLQFADVATAQREREVADDAVRYWRTQLDGAPVLTLPVDFPRPAVRTSAGGLVYVTLPAELVRDVDRLARSQRSTLFMALLTAYQVLLGGHSGQRDVSVGCPLVGREEVEHEPVIGYFTNTVILRGDLSGSPSYVELLRRTRRTFLGALAHQQVPFEELMSELAVERDPSTTPLFQTMFIFQTNGAVDGADDMFDGVEPASFDSGYVQAKCDLLVDVWPDDAGGRVTSFCFNTDLFRRETIEALAQRWLAIVRQLIDEPERPWDEVSQLAPGERDAVLRWGDGGQDVAVGRVPTLVRAAAAAHPAAPAVICGAVVTSYAELSSLTEHWERQLQDAGVREGDLVGVSLGRGEQTVALLLAIWGRGAAYLPIDADHPAQRVALMTADAGLAAVVTAAGAVVRVSGQGRRVPGAAYAIYTSGSSGTPKAVVVGGAAVAARVSFMASSYGLGPSDRVVQFASLSFDAHVEEMWPTLAAGAALVMLPEGPQSLIEVMAADPSITVLDLPTAYWHQLVEAGPLVSWPAALRLVILGGEQVGAASVAAWRARFGDAVRLVNTYGPTEATVIATSAELAGPLANEAERGDAAQVRPPIGRPLTGTAVYVVDPALRLVPPGVTGELCVAGSGLADGYLGRPRLTADQFRPNPYGPAGSRLYRTGDQVRWRPDGQLAYLGRTDLQVKIRGFRVEPGEVEQALRRCPGVADAVIVARDDALVAYVTGTAGADELRSFAADALPAFLVPTTFVCLVELPLTRQGKVDRAALPAATEVRETTTRFVAPRTSTERLIASVWRDVLSVQEVGALDDFFQLGGHSLLAVKATARVSAELGTPTDLRALFTHRTVEALAAAIDSNGPAAEAGPPPQRRPAGTPAPLSPAQERLWFLQQMEPTSAAYNMYVVRRLRGPVDQAALAQAMADVCERHETLRTAYPDHEGIPVTRLCDSAPQVAFVDLRGVSAEDRVSVATRHVAAATNQAFHLADRPPLQLTLLTLDATDHVLCLVLHHIAGDGWSLNILVAELIAAYLARRAGTAAAFPPLTLEYGDVALWQRNRDDTASLEYWRRQLADPTVLDLSTDRPRHQAGAHCGGSVSVRLPEAAVAALSAYCRSKGVTLFVVLLAAYQVLLARHTGQDDIFVGTPEAGRDRVELEPVVGYLTNTLVLRGDLAGDPTFDDLVKRTSATVLGAMSHADIPFERLLDALQTDRDLARTPLFQTMLIMHSQDDDGGFGWTFGDVPMETFPDGYSGAKLDLLIEARRAGRALELTVGYDADLFDESTMQAMTARYVALLEAIPLASSAPVSMLPVLRAEDVALLRHRAYGPRGVTDALVPDLVGWRSAQPAAFCGDLAVSYQQLSDRADALCSLLRARGVRPGDVVGVGLDRCPAAIVAFLAIWRAGAAYLPVDPGLPPDRQALLLNDSAAVAVVTAPDGVDTGAGGPVVVQVMRSGEPLEAVPALPVERAVVHGADPAYVLYTSGSTGAPKGVVVPHHGLAARVTWMRDAYELRPGDRVVQLASLSFDTHVEEIFPALAAGATVVMLPDGPLSLPEFLGTDQGALTTVLDLPTAYWHELVADIDQIAWPAALRLVILGGDQLHASALRRWRESFGNRVRVVNTYGPTEGIVIATATDVGDDVEVGAPPIGRPIADTHVVLLDAAGQLVPPGAPGELCIGGEGVSTGYRGQPGLTAQRYQPDPFGAPGSRLYRSGDRARWRADGELEFLGRLDRQVKVRGTRVEPGEVEACLLAHPGVTAASVIAIDGALVAYLVGDASPDDVRRSLERQLPRQMVPTTWMSVPALPRTTSGKVDYRHLPAPVLQRRADFVAPRTDAERLVAEIWCEVLQLPRVGALEDFFELGGHSLLAARVAARIRADIDVSVPIRTLFTERTVAALAAAVERQLIEEIALLPEDQAERLAHEGLVPERSGRPW